MEKTNFSLNIQAKCYICGTYDILEIHDIQITKKKNVRLNCYKCMDRNSKDSTMEIMSIIIT